MVLVEEALRYKEMGFSVIPLLQRDKRPEINWLEYQKRRPTEDEVRKMFSDERKNVGIICGKVSGNLVVIDFDNSEGLAFVFDLEKLKRQTKVVKTARGFHVYFKVGSGEVNSRKIPNLGIDLQAEGKYVVAPPSIHPTGILYEDVGQDTVVELKDSELIDYAKEMESLYPIGKVIKKYWEEGNRHELSLRLTSLLRQRYGWEEAEVKHLFQGVMRLCADNDEIADRERAIEDAFHKDYPYDSLPKGLLEDLKVELKTQPLRNLTNGTVTLLENDAFQVNPALDLTKENGLILTQPFAIQKTITEEKRGKTRTFQITAVENIVISSDRTFFECNLSEFLKRDMIAKIPDTTLRPRWSIQSRNAFLRKQLQEVDPFQTFDKIRREYEKYIDFGSILGASSFNAIYSIMTYFFVLFDSVPYLKFEGLKGSGKTKAGQIHSLIDFNGMMSVSMSPASIFRTVQDERATLIIDEAENFRSDNEAFSEIMPILNSGYQRSGSVPRIEGERRIRVNYSTYGPKIICSINPIFETLDDRSYKLILIKTTDGSKANISPKESDPIWQTIKDNLYVLTFQCYKEIQELSNSEEIKNSLQLIGRDWDKAKPILTIAHFISKYAPDKGEALKAEIIEFLKQRKQENQEESFDTIESTMIQVLGEMVFESLSDIDENKRLFGTLVEIVQWDLALRIATQEGFDIDGPRFNKKSYSKKIGSKLKNMGLKREATRGTGNYPHFRVSLVDVMNASVRYGIPDTLLNTIISTTQTISTTLTTSTTSIPNPSTILTDNIKRLVTEELNRVKKKLVQVVGVVKSVEKKIQGNQYITEEEIKLFFRHNGFKILKVEREDPGYTVKLPWIRNRDQMEFLHNLEGLSVEIEGSTRNPFTLIRYQGG